MGWIAGCGSDSPAAPPVADPEPRGSLLVRTFTSGPHPDTDGYTLVLDGGNARPIGINDSHTFENLDAGTHTVELTGIDDPCTTSDNPQSVSVTPDQSIPVQFSLHCELPTGSLRLTVAISGEDLDADGYVAVLDGAQTLGALGPAGELDVQGLYIGEYAVQLEGVAPNCRVRGENPQPLAITSNETAVIIFTVECERVEFIYNIGAGVPQSEVDVIKDGIGMGQEFLGEHLDGDILPEIREDATIEIVATGTGQPDSGACCTFGVTGEGIHLFFDVKHPHWDRVSTVPGGPNAEKWKISAHEYTHAWHFSIGCTSSVLFGAWFNEGVAEYLAFEALIWNGETTRAAVMQWALEAARGGGEMDRPLEDRGGVSPGYWPGDIGHIAVDMLVSQAPEGILSLRTVCEEVESGASREAAFEIAFGASLDAFYAEFEEWRQVNK